MDYGRICGDCNDRGLGMSSGKSYLPDLTDPATLGCLLHLVREAWGEPGAYVHHDRPERREPGRPWELWFGDGSNVVGVFPTEAEALVAALEAAPCPE